MGSRGNLIALSVIAAALAAWVVLGAPEAGDARRSTRVLPEHASGPLERLEARGPDGTRLVLERDAGGYRLVEPVQAPADPVAVDDLLRTLELLSYRRSLADPGAIAGLASPRATLTVTYHGRRPVELVLGAHAATTDQDFIARTGRDAVYLIDGYAGRVLARAASGPDALRARRALRTRGRDITGLEIRAGDASLIASGRPLALHLDGVPGSVRADVDAMHALLERIDDVRLTRFVAEPVPPAPADAVSIKLIGEDPGELIEHGPCPGVSGERLVSTPIGVGCVREAELAAIAFAPSLGPALVDRHVVATGEGKPRAIELTCADGVALVMRATGAGWATDAAGPLDAEAVVEWARELDELPGRELVPLPTSAPIARVVIETASGRRDTIGLYRVAGQRVVGRVGEAMGFGVAPEAASVVTPPCVRFRPRSLWSLDPTGLRAVERRHGGAPVRLERGELLEDWTSAAGTVAADAIADLSELLARPRVVAWVASAPRPTHALGASAAEISATFDDLGGGPIRHVLRVGETVDGGCYAQADGDPAVARIAEPMCAVLRGAWTQRE